MLSRSLVPLLFVLGSVGYGGATPEPHILRLRDLGNGPAPAPGQPIIVELEEGDVIPLKFVIQGAFIETPADLPTIPLRVKRHCFVRIDKRGLKTSVDGKNFDWSPAVPGSFRIGLSVTKEGAHADMEFHTPTPPSDLK